jgi:hypothetical protein
VLGGLSLTTEAGADVRIDRDQAGSTTRERTCGEPDSRLAVPAPDLDDASVGIGVRCETMKKPPFERTQPALDVTCDFFYITMRRMPM